MTALKRRALEYPGEAIDPRLPDLRRAFALSVPESHRLVQDLLGAGRDRIVPALIPLVFDWLEEESKRWP
jgi:hypothetical protein